jgi:hypothetical protein
MSDVRRNSDRPEGQEPQPRNPREDFRDQLKRIRDEAVGDLKKSLGMPGDGAGRFRRDEAPSSQERSPSLSGDMAEGMSARASDTARPGAPGTQRIKVSGGVLAQHREKREDPTYTPVDEMDALLDAKDAGQYHVAASAGGMSESAHGANKLDAIRRIYHKLGQQARTAGDSREEVSRYYPRGDPSQVEKGMVDQTRTGMKIIKEAYKDGYTDRPLKPTSEMIQEEQGRKKGPAARPSGIVGSLLNRLRGSSDPGPGVTTVTGVRGSQTDAPEVAQARKLLQDGRLCDGDIEAVLSLLGSSDRDGPERLRTILATYGEEGVRSD